MNRFFYFSTSGTTKKYHTDGDKIFKYSKEKYFSFINEVLIPETFIEKNDTVLGLTTIKGARHIHGSNIQSMCRMLKLKFYRNNKDYHLFKELINDGKISYLFCAPSFVLQTYEYINFKKIKKIQLVGEKINENMKDIFLNKIFDKNQLITNNYGSTETNSIGYKKLEDNKFILIKNSFLKKSNEDVIFYSPYISDDLMYFVIQDNLILKENGFEVLGRKSDANFIKKNGKKIILDELKNNIYKNFKDVFFIKTIIDENKNGEDYIMYILKEKKSSLTEKQIKDFILNNYYFEYIPKHIYITNDIIMPKDKTFKSHYV